MEPRIQYAQTSDGVSIAFWTDWELNARNGHAAFGWATYAKKALLESPHSPATGVSML